MKFTKAANHLENVISKYIDDPTIEIEGRIGIKNSDSFSSNIGDANFEVIKKMLNSGKGKDWLPCEKSINHTDYFDKNYRLSVYEDGTRRCIQKKRIENVDFILDNGTLDFRISISREIPVDIDSFPLTDKCKGSRNKKRSTYKYKMWDFDLTEITQRKDKGDDTSYEFEIELNSERNKIKNPKYISESIILKLLDAIRCCDDDEQKEKKEYKFEKVI